MKTKMTPRTFKMLLIIFFLAAALLNLTNYASYDHAYDIMSYDSTKSTPKKLNKKVHAPRIRRFLTRRRVIRTINWSAILLCTKSKGKDPTQSPTKESASESSPIIDFLAEYKQQTTDNNSFYYYNEILIGLAMCPLQPPGLGPIPVDKTEVELESVEKLYPEVQQGGMYTPPNCTARHKVAIIVPFRDRLQHLAIFLRHMHPFLMRQQIEYGIFVIEQNGNSEFNRAKLMNVGFVESQKLKVGGWQCFIFHDIDLLPLDLRNMYSCPRQPRQLSASIDKLNFKLPPWQVIFGGVSAMTLEQFTKVNGFSNKYWGRGGENDDMRYRMNKVDYHIGKCKMSLTRYAMLDHNKSAPNPKRYQLLSQTSKVFQNDGLSTLEYQIVKVTRNHLYTHILANIDERCWWTYLAKLLFGNKQ